MYPDHHKIVSLSPTVIRRSLIIIVSVLAIAIFCVTPRVTRVTSAAIFVTENSHENGAGFEALNAIMQTPKENPQHRRNPEPSLFGFFPLKFLMGDYQSPASPKS